MKYDEIISLGSSCCPGLSLRNLNLKKETYPFDWVKNNSKIGSTSKSFTAPFLFIKYVVSKHDYADVYQGR